MGMIIVPCPLIFISVNKRFSSSKKNHWGSGCLDSCSLMYSEAKTYDFFFFFLITSAIVPTYSASLVAQMVKKNLFVMQETQVWSLDWEDPLEEAMATHSSILTWRILWTEKPGGLQSMGHIELDTTEQLTLSLSICRVFVGSRLPWLCFLLIV